MNMKNLMMWVIIVLLVLGLFNLFQNPNRTTAIKDLPFSTFITEVGLYNANQQLQAVAKLSSPIEKNFSSEAVIKVNLDY